MKGYLYDSSQSDNTVDIMVRTLRTFGRNCRKLDNESAAIRGTRAVFPKLWVI